MIAPVEPAHRGTAVHAVLELILPGCGNEMFHQSVRVQPSIWACGTVCFERGLYRCASRAIRVCGPHLKYIVQSFQRGTERVLVYKHKHTFILILFY